MKRAARLGAVLLAGLIVRQSFAWTADDLWFFADFDSTPQLDGAAFTARLQAGAPVKGRYGKGYAFVSDEPNCADRFWVIRDQERLAAFPQSRGTFSCWFRSPEARLADARSPGFGYCGFWQRQWSWDAGAFSTGSGAAIKDFRRSSAWRHFAATWTAERLTLYLDGVVAAEREKPTLADMTEVPRRALRIGAACDGSPAANLEMDEVAIFRRDLTAAEVKSIAAAETGLFAGDEPIVANRIEFPRFWRNQENAALRTRFHSVRAVDGVLSGAVAGDAIPPRPFGVGRGETKLAVPFDPSRLKAGRYPWSLRLADARGRTLWTKAGELEILPRRERDEFKFFSWGGMKGVPTDYSRTVGINSCNVQGVANVRKVVADGFFPNIRYENIREYKWTSRDFADDEVESAADADFAPYEGLHVWTTTLVNSEIYGPGFPAQTATNSPQFLARAKREIGVEPNFRYSLAPIALRPATLDGPCPEGVVARGACAQLDTLWWMMARGMPAYRAGERAAKAIHTLDPAHTVWSEPSFEGIPAKFDMLADWHYEYGTHQTLLQLRDFYAWCRPYGKPYMPTLSTKYWSGRRPRISAGPDKGKEGTQSADEVIVKAWLALGAVPAHALSFFYLDGWSEGEVNGTAEPGTGARFGKAWHERLAPAAELLRDLPNERAPLAVVRPSECRYASGLGWGQVHYPDNIELALVRTPVPFDVLYDRDIAAGSVKNYRYALLPMARTLYADHAAALDAAARAGCTIVTDASAARRFDGGVHLDGLSYPYHPDDWHRIGEALMDWYGKVMPGLRDGLTAWSEGTNAFTFVKDFQGVKYVTVVNDLRRTDPGFLNRCVTNDWYRPYGAEQTVVTHFKIPAGAAVYEFNAPKERAAKAGLAEGRLSSVFAPAEGRVYCIYPRPPEKLRMDEVDGHLRVVLVDADGRPAPGRQLVEVEVCDPEGRAHDEAGRYIMTGGCVKIPLRYAKDDPVGSFFSRWKARARELTTGLEASVSWKR